MPYVEDIKRQLRVSGNNIFCIKTTTQLNDETTPLKQERISNAQGRCPPTYCKQLHTCMLSNEMQTTARLRWLIR